MVLFCPIFTFVQTKKNISSRGRSVASEGGEQVLLFFFQKALVNCDILKIYHFGFALTRFELQLNFNYR